MRPGCFQTAFPMSRALCLGSELTSLGCVENYAELGNRAGNDTSLEIQLDFAI